MTDENRLEVAMGLLTERQTDKYAKLCAEIENSECNWCTTKTDPKNCVTWNGVNFCSEACLDEVRGIN